MKKFTSIGLCILLLAGTAYAQNSAGKMLKALQDKFKSIENISAGFVQAENGRVTLSGKFYYEKGNKMRLELKNLLIITDGETSWNYNKRENKVIISSYNPDDPSYFSLKQIIEEYPSKCTVSTDKENGSEVLVLTPNKSGLNFTTAKIWVNSENLISRILLTEQNNALIQVSFSNYKINSFLSRSTFTFTPPKGSKVIDLR